MAVTEALHRRRSRSQLQRIRLAMRTGMVTIADVDGEEEPLVRVELDEEGEADVERESGMAAEVSLPLAGEDAVGVAGEVAGEAEIAGVDAEEGDEDEEEEDEDAGEEQALLAAILRSGTTLTSTSTHSPTSNRTERLDFTSRQTSHPRMS